MYLSDLRGAYLFGAILNGANLAFALFKDALITTKLLEKALTLQGATMPDGSIHP